MDSLEIEINNLNRECDRLKSIELRSLCKSIERLITLLKNTQEEIKKLKEENKSLHKQIVTVYKTDV